MRVGVVIDERPARGRDLGGGGEGDEGEEKRQPDELHKPTAHSRLPGDCSSDRSDAEIVRNGFGWGLMTEVPAWARWTIDAQRQPVSFLPNSQYLSLYWEETALHGDSVGPHRGGSVVSVGISGGVRPMYLD